MNIHLTCAKKLAKSFLFEQGYRITSFDKIEWLKKIKNNIANKIDCSDCEEVYFSESKQPLKSRWGEQKRSVQNCDCKKNEIAKHCWEADHNFSWSQKKVLDTESRLIPRKIKETIHSLKNLITLIKFPTYFLKYGFLNYGSSWLIIYFTPVDSN